MQTETAKRFTRTKTTIVLAVVAATNLAAAFGPVAVAAPSPAQRSPLHQTPYDNTGRGPQQSGMQGGGG
jgi:hypothetical protein